MRRVYGWLSWAKCKEKVKNLAWHNLIDELGLRAVRKQTLFYGVSITYFMFEGVDAF